MGLGSAGLHACCATCLIVEKTLRAHRRILMARRHISIFAVTLVLACSFAGRILAAVNLVDVRPDSTSAAVGSFPLVVKGVAAPIVLPPGAPPVIKIAADDLAGDIADVSGVRPKVLAAAPTDMNRPHVELAFSPELAGRWEAFEISATSNVLKIAGSDPRGLAYGIYEISSRIGVSPWHWWADVPAPHHSELRLTAGEEPIDQPAVKYRGIFINDEDWGLLPWASKTFEPKVGNIGPKTYSRIFDLLLRLRGNLIWPAMHPKTTPFFLMPGNAAEADAYDIIVGSSHAEPMLRDNDREWKAPKKDFNFLTHRKEVLAYWEERVKQRTHGQSLFTIGMRGVGDSPIIGPKTQAQRIATLEQVFADQRKLLARYLGGGDPTRVGQIFCPYKEVLADYNAGLRVPDDVTIVWPDDNYGYIRHFGTPAERERSGGLGVYYHLSYLGAPLSWTWIDTMSPALIWSEMTRAYEQGARTLWIANVGDIKNTERSTEFFLHLAWHANHTDRGAPARFLLACAARDFGEEHAAAIADILTRLQAINFARKTEHLQWYLPFTPYKPTELNETEIHRRLQACSALERDSQELADQLPADARDAYFELVGYPVGITAAANERYFHTELARADVVRGRPSELDRVKSIDAGKRMAKLTDYYNNDVAGGKWRYIVTENGISHRDWKRFQPDTGGVLPHPTENNVCPPAAPALGPLAHPAGAVSGDFVERAGVVSMDAGHFSRRTDLASGAGWRVIPGLGRTGSAVTVLPSTARISRGNAPRLNYRFFVSAGGSATVHVRLLPTYPLVMGSGLRLAVAVDNEAPIPVAVTEGFKPESRQWDRRVLSNATEAVVKLPQPLAAGWHDLHLVAVDAGVFVDKIVLDFGGLYPSYDGPPETRIR